MINSGFHLYWMDKTHGLFIIVMQYKAAMQGGQDMNGRKPVAQAATVLKTGFKRLCIVNFRYFPDQHELQRTG
jgi:hypothetical protein